MLRRAAPVGVALAVLLAPAAHADGGGTGIGTGDCQAATLYVRVCAEDNSTTPGSGRRSNAGASSTGDSDGPECTYTRLNPQPPPDNYYWKGHQSQKGAVYGVNCPDGRGAWTVFVPEGRAPAAPQIDPTVVAQRAVDSMKLVGPKVASPRAAGTYVVGMPMWMWVEPSPTTYGPSTATATAGGVTVSATAKVARVSWDMGDGSPPVVCNGPGTKYTAGMGKAVSPDCGHVYTATSPSADGRFRGMATATWTVDWQVIGATGDTGQLTEIRETPFTAEIHEAQTLN
ncbi:ATP/GTP-binding protein [Streptomyces sp. NPDC047009]|uniref:ATP/GTP-binding protein n=1 Tax=Streptomyces sp. NPDC047009 TaxID=3154496 RepID=UPI0033EF544B